MGKALRGDRGEIWRYRGGDYRLLCRMEDEVLVILVVTIFKQWGGTRKKTAGRELDRRTWSQMPPAHVAVL